jgi:hypothetical protein
VGGLVQVLGVEGGAETEGHACAELDVVCEGGDTAVVDLGLWAREEKGARLVHGFNRALAEGMRGMGG